MAYSDFININITHTFYEDGTLNDDFIYVPTPDTMAWLKKKRILFRQLDTGIKTLIKENGAGTDGIIGLENRTLAFMMMLRTPNSQNFINVTDLDETGGDRYASGNVIHLGDSGAAALDYSLLDGTRPSVFTFTSAVVGASGTLEVRKNGSLVHIGNDADGNPLPNPITLNKDANDNFAQSLDLRRAGVGRYDLTFTDADGAQNFSYYVDAEVHRSNPFGIIEANIVTGASPNILPKASPTDYTFEFARRSTYWRYIVVNKSGIELDDFDLQISDQSGDDSASGSPVYSEYTFSSAVAGTPVNGVESVVIDSSDLIPFYQIPKLNLVLEKKEKVGGATPVPLIEGLTNPRRTTTVLKKRTGGDPDNLAEIYVNV